MTQMSEPVGTITMIIHPVLRPTLNPSLIHMPPRGVTTTKALEAGGGRQKGAHYGTHATGQRYIKGEETPKGKTRDPQKEEKGQTRKEGAQAHQNL
jgi:hypothetical protein